MKRKPPFDSKWVGLVEKVAANIKDSKLPSSLKMAVCAATICTELNKYRKKVGLAEAVSLLDGLEHEIAMGLVFQEARDCELKKTKKRK